MCKKIIEFFTIGKKLEKIFRNTYDDNDNYLIMKKRYNVCILTLIRPKLKKIPKWVKNNPYIFNWVFLNPNRSDKGPCTEG